MLYSRQDRLSGKPSVRARRKVYAPAVQPNGMNRGSALLQRVAAAVVVVAAVSLLCSTPATVADTVSADVLPDGEVELRVSSGNVTAKRTSFTSPDTRYVELTIYVHRQCPYLD